MVRRFFNPHPPSYDVLNRSQPRNWFFLRVPAVRWLKAVCEYGAASGMGWGDPSGDGLWGRIGGPATSLPGDARGLFATTVYTHPGCFLYMSA